MDLVVDPARRRRVAVNSRNPNIRASVAKGLRE
jgi:hypothetical protein